MSPSACILGCQGPRLTDDEKAFFAEVRPWGFILFARNVVSREQTRALCDELRESVGDEEALVFVDQEGGRVQRLKPPLAARRPAAERFGELYARDPEAAIEAAFLSHRLMAEELTGCGLDADCAPCVDLRHAEGHGVIGDRAFGEAPAQAAALGRAALDGLLAGGVAPVIKHIPGHGRARADSHAELPVVTTPLEVLEATDFEPFRALADSPMAMTAHVAFTDIDADACVTLSHHAIATVVRGLIGFDGLLLSDDLSMKALGGDLAERTGRAIEAGCDVVIHGNGALTGEPVRDLMAELKAVAYASRPLSGRSAERAADARASARGRRAFDAAAAESRLMELGLGGRVAA